MIEILDINVWNQTYTKFVCFVNQFQSTTKFHLTCMINWWVYGVHIPKLGKQSLMALKTWIAYCTIVDFCHYSLQILKWICTLLNHCIISTCWNLWKFKTFAKCGTCIFDLGIFFWCSSFGQDGECNSNASLIHHFECKHFYNLHIRG